jgi:hypothetical protein
MSFGPLPFAILKPVLGLERLELGAEAILQVQRKRMKGLSEIAHRRLSCT